MSKLDGISLSAALNLRDAALGRLTEVEGRLENAERERDDLRLQVERLKAAIK